MPSPGAVNPVLVKDLRLWLRARAFVGGYILLVFAAALAAFLHALDARANVRDGRGLWALAVGAALAVCGGFAPYFVHDRFRDERESPAGELLRLTRLSPARVARGKIYGAWCASSLALSALAPAFVTAALGGGVDASVALFQFAFVLAAAVAMPCLFLFALSLGTHVFGRVVAVLLLALWCALASRLSLVFARGFPAPADLHREAPWILLAVFLAAAGGFARLLHALAVHRMRPPDEKRQWPIRLELLLWSLVNALVWVGGCAAALRADAAAAAADGAAAASGPSGLAGFGVIGGVGSLGGWGADKARLALHAFAALFSLGFGLGFLLLSLSGARAAASLPHMPSLNEFYGDWRRRAQSGLSNGGDAGGLGRAGAADSLCAYFLFASLLVFLACLGARCAGAELAGATDAAVALKAAVESMTAGGPGFEGYFWPVALAAPCVVAPGLAAHALLVEPALARRRRSAPAFATILGVQTLALAAALAGVSLAATGHLPAIWRTALCALGPPGWFFLKTSDRTPAALVTGGVLALSHAGLLFAALRAFFRARAARAYLLPNESKASASFAGLRAGVGESAWLPRRRRESRAPGAGDGVDPNAAGAAGIKTVGVSGRFGAATGRRAWINAMLVKDLRLWWGNRVFAAGFLGLVLAAAFAALLLAADARVHGGDGRGLWNLALGATLALACGLLPYFVHDRFRAERQSGAYELVRLSRLGPARVVDGKIASARLAALVAAAACSPAFAGAFAIGGVDAPTAARTLAVLALAAWIAPAPFVFMATLPVNIMSRGSALLALLSALGISAAVAAGVSVDWPAPIAARAAAATTAAAAVAAWVASLGGPLWTSGFAEAVFYGAAVVFALTVGRYFRSLAICRLRSFAEDRDAPARRSLLFLTAVAGLAAWAVFGDGVLAAGAVSAVFGAGFLLLVMDDSVDQRPKPSRGGAAEASTTPDGGKGFFKKRLAAARAGMSSAWSALSAWFFAPGFDPLCRLFLLAAAAFAPLAAPMTGSVIRGGGEYGANPLLLWGPFYVLSTGLALHRNVAEPFLARRGRSSPPAATIVGTQILLAAVGLLLRGFVDAGLIRRLWKAPLYALSPVTWGELYRPDIPVATVVVLGLTLCACLFAWPTPPKDPGSAQKQN